MIRPVWFVLLLGAFLAQPVIGQTLTKEKKKSVEKTEGDTTTTESVIISQSEDITPHTQMLLVNPLKFLLFYNLSYLHRLSPSVTLGAGIQFPTPRDVSGYGLNAEVRFYPSGKSPRGFYFAPNIAYNKIWSGDEKTEPFSAGALLGWQWFPGDDFAIGLGIGADYYTGSVSSGSDDLEKYDGWAPALRFDIGYAW
jgi:hypothetical protein